ncbi:MAG TPA: YdcF family protein [Burkholderiales bacterium]|nr:YdcF family protein [Burkholderiales bacterium]
MKKIISRVLQVIGLLSLVALFLGSAGLYFAGRWLVLDETPAKADLIVLLGGDLSRPLYGADLYHRGYAKRIAVSRPAPPPQTENLRTLGMQLPRQDEQFREVLRRKRVPGNVISVFGDANLSTVQEAETLREFLGDRPVRLLIVTSPYHTRRVKIVFTRLLPRADIRVLASPYETYPQRWWTDQSAAVGTLLETAKLLYYYLGGAFRTSPPTATKAMQETVN